jgi:PAS domain S-box-containing protein
MMEHSTSSSRAQNSHRIVGASPAPNQHIVFLHHKRSSPTISSFSTFSPEKILPEFPPAQTLRLVQKAAKEEMYSSSRSDTSDSVFDLAGEPVEDITQSTQVTPFSGSGDETTSYDLQAPPPSISQLNAEALAGRLFSVDHLNLILRDYKLCASFTSYINTYQSHLAPIFARHQATQKAKSAIDYANTVAESMPPTYPPSSLNPSAATIGSMFQESAQSAADELTRDALPGYVTHRLVQTVTECLVKNIMGSNTPLMIDLVHGLAEVYCMTDPSLPDNPIVYASDEFCKTTQYGREYVIGRNCRFLQGPKTSMATVKRLSTAVSKSTEICETILNYRRDGSPFLNLIMMAPLYDNQSRVRYFIGCQIDVTQLIEGGRGLDSFQRLLNQDRMEARFGEMNQTKSPKKALRDLGLLLGKDELETLRYRASDPNQSGRSTPVRPSTGRRHFMGEEFERDIWPAARLGHSGRLPGVYQNVRYHSSLQ